MLWVLCHRASIYEVDLRMCFVLRKRSAECLGGISWLNQGSFVDRGPFWDDSVGTRLASLQNEYTYNSSIDVIAVFVALIICEFLCRSFFQKNGLDQELWEELLQVLQS